MEITFLSSDTSATTEKLNFVAVRFAHPGFNILQAVDKRHGGELSTTFGANVHLCVINLAMETESMGVDYLSKGEHVYNEEKGPGGHRG